MGKGGCGLAKMRIVSLMYYLLRQRQRRNGIDDVLYWVPAPFRRHFFVASPTT